MKQVLIVLLIFLTLASTLKELSIYISFKVHQEEIAFTVCKSKGIPNNTCQGACYLEKQLDKTHHHEQNPSGKAFKSPKQKDLSMYREILDKSQNKLLITVSDYKVYISGAACEGFLNTLLDPPEIS